MTNVPSKDAVVLAYLARHGDPSSTEWDELVSGLEGAARELADKLKIARLEEIAAEISRKKKSGAAIARGFELAKT